MDRLAQLCLVDLVPLDLRVQGALGRLLLLIGLASVPFTQVFEASQVANVLEWTGGLAMLLQTRPGLAQWLPRLRGKPQESRD